MTWPAGGQAAKIAFRWRLPIAATNALPYASHVEKEKARTIDAPAASSTNVAGTLSEFWCGESDCLPEWVSEYPLRDAKHHRTQEASKKANAVSRQRF